jgi:hypothetical protein
MGALTQDDPNAVAAKLNGSHRRALDFDMPSDRFHALLR